jgi:16S rRNA (guanine527-N7)-methyltransferase
MNCRDALPMLLEGARALGIELPAESGEKFVAYCRFLSEANDHVNLTALRTPEAMMTGLFLDSLTCVLALPSDMRDHRTEVAVVDVGSGAGIPGVPLRLIHPGWRLTMIESIGKKAHFLGDLVQRLDLDNANVLAERAEIVAAEPRHRDRADLCLARAVAPLPTLIELCAPLVRPGGTLIFPKGKDATGEVEAALPAAQAVGARWDATIRLPPGLAHLGEDRVLVRYRKRCVTPAGYPRHVGIARSRPIMASQPSRPPTRGRRARPE